MPSDNAIIDIQNIHSDENTKKAFSKGLAAMEKQAGILVEKRAKLVEEQEEKRFTDSFLNFDELNKLAHPANESVGEHAKYPSDAEAVMTSVVIGNRAPAAHHVQQNLFSSESSTEDFSKHELQVKPDQLTLAIDEFFKVQREFSENMNALVETLSTYHFLNQENQAFQLEDLLRSYRLLTVNPFNNHPSGNNQEDILHILETINERNDHFLKLLRALSVSIGKTSFTHEVLDQIKSQPGLEQKFKDALNCQSWSQVQWLVDKPFQNLARFELLLREILKKIQTGDGDEFVDLTEKLKSLLVYLAPKVHAINENIDSLVLLNRMEQVLAAIISGDHLGNDDSPLGIKLKSLAQLTIDSIRQGERLILSGDQDQLVLFKNLLVFLLKFERNYSRYQSENVTLKDKVYNTAKYAYTFFANEDKNSQLDPHEQVKHLIVELRDQVEGINIIRDIPRINTKAINAYK